MKGPAAFPWVIGHRGAAGHAPENTRASFQTAWRLGADAVECDVHLSRDGRAVVIHDETLDRTTTGAGFVKDLSWAALRRLGAAKGAGRRFAGERLWLLGDLARWVRPRKATSGRPLGIVVEIKDDRVRYPGIAEKVVRVLRREGLLARAMVISFNHDTMRQVKALCPALKTGLLFSRLPADLGRRMRRSRADAVFPRWTLVTPAFMARARRKGWFVGVWTANTSSELKELVRRGVDAVATNYPDRLAGLRP